MVVPLTKRLLSKLLAQQCQRTYTWGGRYLQSNSRALGAALFIKTDLAYLISDSLKVGNRIDWLVLTMVLTLPSRAVRDLFHDWTGTASIGGRGENVTKELQVEFPFGACLTTKQLRPLDSDLDMCDERGGDLPGIRSSTQSTYKSAIPKAYNGRTRASISTPGSSPMYCECRQGSST